MLHSRRIGSFELFQIAEFTGPTHDADFMLPGLAREAFEANASWLQPHYWLAPTNRLVFTMQLFVLKARDRVIVIDTGVGNHKARRAGAQNMINTPMQDWLRAIGAAPERVTHVVLTHLHGDHVGWNTVRVGERWEPFFPNASYFLPRDDFAVFEQRYQQGDRDLFGAPFEDSILPLLSQSAIRFVAAGDEIADCLTARAAPGHTAGQLTYTLRTDDPRAFVFSADVLHSPIQVIYPQINSRWCELPDEARRTRHALLAEAARSESIVLPAHAGGLGGWMVTREGEGFAVRFDA